jgi:prophage tail gpP-like protein
MSVKKITQASAVKASATDATITRNRTLIIVAESAAGPGYAQARATFEARIRKAKGDTGEVTVQGWRAPDGSLWAVNRQVWISSITTRMGGYYLVAEVEYSIDNEGGTITKLKLKDPDAYLAAATFTAADTVDIATLEAKKSRRSIKRTNRQSLRGIL